MRRKTAIKLIAILVLLAVVSGLWMLITGFSARSDVFLYDYTVSTSGDAMRIHVGVASSMGYVRACKDVSHDPEEVYLRFYSAFGGLNSSLGARDVFEVPLDGSCTKVYFEDGKDKSPVLCKNPVSGVWERAE